jgi:hypothetical protein
VVPENSIRPSRGWDSCITATAPIVFNGMTVSTSVLTLTNPIYAGYAFGRTTSRVSVENGRKRVRRGVHRPMAEFAGNFGTWFAHFVVLAQSKNQIILSAEKKLPQLSDLIWVPARSAAQIYMTVAREAVEYCRDRLQWILPASVISARRE